jgi:low affinity Fe/Cu permease
MPRREKSPGVKILWIWTFGTAASTFLFLPFNQTLSLHQQITHTLSCFVVAVLIANVMRTRIRDFQSVMDAEEQQQQQQQQNDNGISEDRIIDS